MSIAGLSLLLAIVLAVRSFGRRLIPLLMPPGRLKIIALGWLGGLAGSLMDGATWQIGPEVVGVQLVAAIISCLVVILAWGLAPFIRTFLGKA